MGQPWQVYMDYLEPWCRNAYMDVALNSYSFVQSALHVSWVNNGDFVDTVHVLNGATWLFQLAGLGAITSLGHLQVCVLTLAERTRCWLPDESGNVWVFWCVWNGQDRSVPLVACFE